MSEIPVVWIICTDGVPAPNSDTYASREIACSYLSYGETPEPFVPKSALDAATSRIDWLLEENGKLAAQALEATARAEQAEAECAAAKEAYRILDTHYAPFAVTHRFMMPSEERLQQLRRLLASDSGKSTGDELRRLRENNAAMHRSLTALFHANASGDERDVNEAVEFAGIVLNRIAVQAAQPPRAERSE